MGLGTAQPIHVASASSNTAPPVHARPAERPNHLGNGANAEEQRARETAAAEASCPEGRKTYACQIMWYKQTFDRFLPDPGDARASQADLAAAAANPIDIVIAWSGPAQVAASGVRERDNGEMVYLLRSVAKHAPWVHHVWIVVNGVVPLPEYVPKSLLGRVDVLDRCTYMPAGTCPSKNSHQVQMYVHHIPNLVEQYVVAEDDIFLGKPARPEDFFPRPNTPHVWRKGPSWGDFPSRRVHKLYKNSGRVSFPTPKSTAPSPHYYYPMLKSVAFSLEQQYPEYFKFALSHSQGRWNSYTGDYTPHEMDQEECFYGIMNAELLRTGNGVYKDIDGGKDFPFNGWHGEVRDYSRAGFEGVVAKPPFFLNVNDRFIHDSGYSSIWYYQVAVCFGSFVLLLFCAPAANSRMVRRQLLTCIKCGRV